MSIACEVRSFEITMYRRPVTGDVYHPGRFWCEIRRAGTDDVVHTTAEYITGGKATAAAHAWIEQQGGRAVRPWESN